VSEPRADDAPPRYSSRSLPSRAFVPGVSTRADRPTAPPPRRSAVDLDALGADDDFRHGVDLWNAGFPWEAHEAWEPLWFAAPPGRPERALLHGLIHAAAAAIKARAGGLDVARGFIDSAREELLAAGASPVFDAADFAAALAAWGNDPTKPPPPLRLATG
jgi:uncharacterized protein